MTDFHASFQAELSAARADVTAEIDRLLSDVDALTAKLSASQCQTYDWDGFFLRARTHVEGAWRALGYAKTALHDR